MEVNVNEILGQFKSILRQDKNNIQKVKVIYNPKSYSFSELGRTSSTNQSKQDEADLTFTNPLDREIVIKEISLIPDDTFKIKGMLKITVNDVPIFSNKAVADFTDVIDLAVKLIEGKTILPQDSVKIFIWNETDGNAVSLTCLVTFGE